MVNGWGFRDPDSFMKWGDEIRRYFLPKERYIRQAREVVDQIRRDSDVVIGVHVRRTDYAQWSGGRYSFGDQVYRKAIQDMVGQMAPMKAGFLIASDEPVNLKNYDSLGCRIAWDRREPMVDLMALSMCDFIVGPPSTFSMWASFYGRVPLCFITDPECYVDLKKASVSS
jgi:hypothetical protein